ncbi:histidine-rich protein [Trichinella spiralis]|nr:histidine-rich protein [Trichinella spiralis]
MITANMQNAKHSHTHTHHVMHHKCISIMLHLWKRNFANAEN